MVVGFTPIDTPDDMTSDNRPDLAAILPHLRQWHTDQCAPLTAAGITVTVRESPPEWDKASISITLESGPRCAQLIVWDSGETEFGLVDFDTLEHTPQHRIITTPNDLDGLLRQQLAWL